MIATTNKKEFLKVEHGEWEYWKDFSYAEYLRVMECDAVKCPTCKVYFWDGCKKRCSC